MTAAHANTELNTAVATFNAKDSPERPARAGFDEGTNGIDDGLPGQPETDQALRLASNYVFETSTDSALVDMGSGTTLLVAANVDDGASTVAPIGFAFWLDGSPFTQFSANSNGLIRLGPAAVQNAAPFKPLGFSDRFLITAFGSDQRTHTSGRVHYRLDGSAPNRVLVVEFLNMQSNFSAGGNPDLSYQVLLHEGSSRIEFRYGSMTMSAAGAGALGSRDPHIGFSSGSVAGTIGTVTAPQSGDPAPSFAGNVPAAVANLYVAGPIDVLGSAADGARRVFRFTPPPVRKVPDTPPWLWPSTSAAARADRRSCSGTQRRHARWSSAHRSASPATAASVRPPVVR